MYSTTAKHLFHKMRRNLVRRVTNPSKLRQFRHQRCYHEVSYDRYGKDPREVLSYRSDPTIADLDAPRDTTDNPFVRVEMMHSPWNPADANTVQGRYPSPYGSFTTTTPSNGTSLRVASKHCISPYFDQNLVIGSEGWGRVTHSSSPSIPEGSLVTLGLPGLGTLRSSLWVPASAVLPVQEYVYERLGPSGASLFQLGGTALRLLSEFVAPGEPIVQNAGSSGVGFLASQLAASPWLFGSSSPIMISLIRRRGRSKQEFETAVEHLTRVGKNALVVAEEDFFLDDENGKTTIDNAAIRELREQLKELSPTGSLPKLALNSVGGDSARILLKLLAPGSTLVTYGGMSGKGVDLPTPQLIFSDVRAVGYWHSRWMVREHQDDSGNRRAAMVDTLSMLVQEENLQCPPSKVFGLHDLQEGLLWHENQTKDLADQSPVRTKLIWNCRE